MESLLARALESKLKQWLRSFSRDQFKLQGRSVVLHNLDVDGDVLHSTLGLPPSLSVSQARIGKLELKLPYISNVKTEPIVLEIDKLDLVLAEKLDFQPGAPRNQNVSGKSTGYGFADQIADGMTIQVGTVNLMLETRGGSRDRGGAAWTPPLASITMRGILLYTTNEHWKVVNLKEAKNFYSDKKCIYIFKKLEWESISMDLLPHPDMFDKQLSSSNKEKDGARRLFFGGERFLDNISGAAYITMHRSEQNNPIGLEVQVVIPEAVCPALSEPGLRALLRFMTGFYVCLNRGDVDPTTVQMDESPSRTLVGVTVEHIFLGIKDADFKLELLAQSLRYARASIPEGGSVKTLGKISLGGLFLRDTFSQPPCILVQPSVLESPSDGFSPPAFAGEKLWPCIYPLLFEHSSKTEDSPVLTLYSLQMVPSPLPPAIASQSVIQCQPLKIYLQEKSCLQMASLLADGITVEPGVVRPDSSLSSSFFSLREFDLTVPMKPEDVTSFTGARLHVRGLIVAENPTLSYRLLNLDSDPACFVFWKGQLPDSSQKRLVIRANQLTIALETSNSGSSPSSPDEELWSCVELRELSVEVAMATADGQPLIKAPPAGGVLRLGVSCERFISNSSVEQLLFVLEMHSYLGEVARAFAGSSERNKDSKPGASLEEMIDSAPSDSAVMLALESLEINFLQCLVPLVKFLGNGLEFKVTHRTLGGAIAVSSGLHWESLRVECVETEAPEGEMRAILWVEKCPEGASAAAGRRPLFLDVSVVHMMPYRSEDSDCHSLKVSARVWGVRLGGGFIYSESLLHKFGILGPDGGPGDELKKVVKRLSSGPLRHLFQASHSLSNAGKSSGGDDDESSWDLKRPDNMELSVELIDWLFALEGSERVGAADECWHSTFKCLAVKAEDHQQASGPRVTITLQGLQALKPRKQESPEYRRSNDGLALEVRLATKADEASEMEIGLGEWIVETVRASVKEPVEMEATKDELELLVELAKAEAEAASRVAVGVLRLLKLQGSLGQAAIDQLSSLGSGSLDRYLSPERSRRASSVSSVSFSPSPFSSLRPRELHEEMMISGNTLNNALIADQLEESIAKSHQFCSSLESDLKTSSPSLSSLNSIASLRKQLSQMQSLVQGLK